MNCVSTPDQIAATLPRPQGLLGGVLHLVRSAAGRWQQGLIAAQATEAPPVYVLNARDLSDHLLRDIGYLDTLPPREPARQDTVY
jgi:hypothetical protein